VEWLHDKGDVLDPQLGYLDKQDHELTDVLGHYEGQGP
jgi:hypothetical protein